MKIIGTTNGGYVAELSHTELEKFMGLYYNKLERLKPGEEIDLGKGYDHHREIMDAMQKTQSFIASHQQVITAITNGLSLVQFTNE